MCIYYVCMYVRWLSILFSSPSFCLPGAEQQQVPTGANATGHSLCPHTFCAQACGTVPTKSSLPCSWASQLSVP